MKNTSHQGHPGRAAVSAQHHPRLALSGVALAALALCSTGAHAVPSFARQTGMDCSGCHIGNFGPQLTPAGIRFKLGGYTDTDGKGDKNPLSGMVVASWTRTKTDQDPAPTHLKANNNLTFDEASLFAAGRLSDQVGAFSQLTYSGIDRSVALDQVDLRWARSVTLGGKDATFGLSLNNNPTVQDAFNTLPVWSFPYTSGEAAFGTGGAASLLNGGLSQRVLGATAYGFWNSFYGELGTYRSLSPTMQRNLGAGRDEQRLGANAYWRLAYFRDTKVQNYSVGLVGWNVRLSPDRLPGTAVNRYRDVGVDASYQFIGDRRHVFTVNASHMRERLAFGDGTVNQLRENRLSASYNFASTWGTTVGLFNTHGSDPAAATRGQLFQVDWTPWGTEDRVAAEPFGWANLRLGVQYWRYDAFEGDSLGAKDHNTWRVFAWTAF